MDQRHKTILDRNLIRLKGEMEWKAVLDKLIVSGVFRGNSEAVEDIHAERIESDKRKKVVMELQTRGKDAFRHFVLALAQLSKGNQALARKLATESDASKATSNLVDEVEAEIRKIHVPEVAAEAIPTTLATEEQSPSLASGQFGNFSASRETITAVQAEGAGDFRPEDHQPVVTQESLQDRADDRGEIGSRKHSPTNRTPWYHTPLLPFGMVGVVGLASMAMAPGDQQKLIMTAFLAVVGAMTVVALKGH